MVVYYPLHLHGLGTVHGCIIAGRACALPGLSFFRVILCKVIFQSVQGFRYGLP